MHHSRNCLLIGLFLWCRLLPILFPLTPWYLFLGILTPCILWVDSPLMQCLVLERMGQHAISIHPVHDDFM